MAHGRYDLHLKEIKKYAGDAGGAELDAVIEKVKAVNAEVSTRASPPHAGSARISCNCGSGAAWDGNGEWQQAYWRMHGTHGRV